MINYQCDARYTFKMQSDAENDEQIIELAHAISMMRWEEDLDSWDLGDAMGVFIRAAIEEFYAGDLFTVFPGDGFIVQIDIDIDLFDWKKKGA